MMKMSEEGAFEGGGRRMNGHEDGEEKVVNLEERMESEGSEMKKEMMMVKMMEKW